MSCLTAVSRTWGSASLAMKQKASTGKPLPEIAKSDPGFLSWMLSIDVPGDAKEIVRNTLSKAGQGT